MKVVFVQPYFKNIWESVGIGYIVAYCKSHLIGADYTVLQENFTSFDDIVRRCRDANIVAFSATSPVYARALQFARAVKQTNSSAWTVLGGWHASAVDPGTIDRSCIDQVVQGEGEEAFLQILQGNRAPTLRALKLDFDALPWPDREAINEGRQVDYCQSTWGERIASLQSLRGCRMSCKMCAQACMTGRYNAETNPLRMRDPVDTMNELEWMQKKYRIERFKFLDPTWAVSDETVFAFCEEKLRRDNAVKWDAEVHAHFATREGLEVMARAGCDVIMVGCESGSQRSLNELRKGTTLEEIRRVFAWARELGMRRRSFFMIGIPGETRQDVAATYGLIRRYGPTYSA